MDTTCSLDRLSLARLLLSGYTSCGCFSKWPLPETNGVSLARSDGQGSRFLSHSRVGVFRQAVKPAAMTSCLHHLVWNTADCRCRTVFSGLQASDDASGGHNASHCIGSLPDALASHVTVQAHRSSCCMSCQVLTIYWVTQNYKVPWCTGLTISLSADSALRSLSLSLSLLNDIV